MHLTVDARSCNSHTFDYGRKHIKLNNLNKIEDLLDCSEKISILFLMTTNYATAFDTILKLYEEAQNGSYVISEFLLYDNENWNEKLLEAIYIIKNYQILRVLGIPYTEIERIYISKDKLWSKNVNPVAKCLFTLCETLTEEKTKLLIKYVAEDIGSYDSKIEQNNILEIHILYWLKIKYISLSKDAKINFKPLYKHFKKIDDLEIISADLEYYENSQSILHGNQENACGIDSESLALSNNPANAEIKVISKGLCIIINQKYFDGGEYQERDGTDTDRDSLIDTFQQFGFNVHVYENVKKSEFLKKIKKIPENFGVEYECLVVCILSHGYQGGIITTDNKRIPIETIEDNLCCPKLENIYKICIIQACQGKITGRVKTSLVTDGLTSMEYNDYDEEEECNVSRYRNYCCFLSTMQRFISVRHRIDGSWFIQELCHVLKSFGDKVSFQECTQKVIATIQDKEGQIDGGPLAAQIPELRSRLPNNFKFLKKSS